MFWGGDARADSDVLFNWLAAGTKGAPCNIVTPQTCHRFLGNECVLSQCDTARAIGDVNCPSGSPDCNVCVHNVRQKFDELFMLGGAYLMVGSEGSRRGGNHFLLLEGNIESPTRMRYMGFLEYGGPSQYIASENLSLITECGTGDIYTVHVAGDDSVDWGPVSAGEGHFRLSKVSWNNSVDRPILTYQTARTMDQDDEDCWLRGAGTIHSKPGGIEAYCHSRDENSSGSNRFDYKVLRPTVVVQPPGPCPPGEVCVDLCGEPPLPACNF